jgi:hypothetical protein
MTEIAGTLMNMYMPGLQPTLDVNCGTIVDSRALALGTG